ncbi:Dynamin-related protein 4C [Platanthera guangdongensis]|uniref:Dynamin-related protein 4C n=1 Tax=Platanthera guangdongensis TaxID=2320717 RepID=A0ABR2N3T9_9ASPA
MLENNPDCFDDGLAAPCEKAQQVPTETLRKITMMEAVTGKYRPSYATANVSVFENRMSRPPINRNDPPHFVEKLQQKSHQVVKEILEMEMLKNYTCNPDYMKMWTELMDGQEASWKPFAITQSLRS